MNHPVQHLLQAFPNAPFRRRLLAGACAALTACLLAGTAHAAGPVEPYPSKPIRLIVPYTPGQGADSAARMVAAKLAEQLKQSIIIDNRPGAGGNIGSELVAKAPADGYTLLVGSNATHAANSSLYQNLRFDPIADFVPISYIGSVSMVMLAAPGFPAQSMADLVKLAKSQPNTFNVAIPSTTSRVVLELLSVTSGAQFKDIAYKGSAAAVTDLMGGHVQLSIDTAMAATPHVNSGKLKALGVSTAGRTAVLPNVRTFNESGISGFDLSAWNVWFAPKGTPPEIVERLNHEIRAVLVDPEIKAKMRALGYEPAGAESPQKVAEFVRAETRKWGDLVKSAGLKGE